MSFQVDTLLQRWVVGELAFVLSKENVSQAIGDGEIVVETQERSLRSDMAERHPTNRSPEGAYEQDTSENASMGEQHHEHIPGSTRSIVQGDDESRVHHASFPRSLNQSLRLDRITLDLFVVDQEHQLPLGQPTITLLQETFTAYPSGFSLSFGEYSAATDMECIRHAILPKKDVKQLFQTDHDYLAYGLPQSLEVDATKEFHPDVEIACAQLGIEIIDVAPRTSLLEEPLRRWFGEATPDLLYRKQETIFSHVLERDSSSQEEHRCLTLDALYELLYTWILDSYTQKIQEGVGGYSEARGIPAELWQQACDSGFSSRLPLVASDLRALFPRSLRVIQHDSIMLHSILYQGSELQWLRRSLRSSNRTTPVWVMYSPWDISRVWVRDPETHEDLEVLAVDQAYTSHLSYWSHRGIQRYVRKELQCAVNYTSLSRAKTLLQQHVQEAFRRTKSKKTCPGADSLRDMYFHLSQEHGLYTTQSSVFQASEE